RNRQEGTCAANGAQCREINLRTGVRNVQRAALAHPTKSWFINTDLFAVSGHRYRTEMRPRNEIVALTKSQPQVIDSANPGGTLDDGIEYGLHIRRRAADDAKHLGRCRLMLQRFAQFCIALLDFLEQAHILDGDDRLIGESFEKYDLLVGEGLNLHAA